MSSDLNIKNIYEQNLNFLIGSGASFGYLPTLELSIKDSVTGEKYTIETLSFELTRRGEDILNTLLFMYYYDKCIKPAIASPPDDESEVISNYTDFIETIVRVLGRKKSNDRRCNIYTTNYDGCIEFSAENFLNKNGQMVVFNDGSSGFKSRYFHTRNYNNQIIPKGIFDHRSLPIPQVNILHIHGSVYWKKEGSRVTVDYKNKSDIVFFSDEEIEVLKYFSGILEDQEATEEELLNFLTDDDEIDCDGFWDKYNTLPIVNPTKWKFHETVFEENYYQLLRHLSFELERPNTVFVTFGFSFADEHILHLVERSLSNPSLTVYVCCFNSDEVTLMKEKFIGYPNVKFISTTDPLNFKVFNSDVFSLVKNDENFYG